LALFFTTIFYPELDNYAFIVWMHNEVNERQSSLYHED